MHSPLVPVHVPMDLQGHFPNILLSEKENILSLILSLGTFRLFNRFVPIFVLQMICLGTRDISIICPSKDKDISNFVLRYVLRYVPVPIFVPRHFWEKFPYF